jgi:hypothetical protein
MIQAALVANNQRNLVKRRCDKRIYEQLSLDSLIAEPCKQVRMCAACPNNQECRSAFGNVGDFSGVIRGFRKSLWDGTDKRGERLKVKLSEMTTVLEGEAPVVNFNINGKPVCKHFFREATGFQRQLVDELIACAQGRKTLERQHSILGSDCLTAYEKMTRRQSTVLSFYEKQYAKNRVEHDPGTGNVLTIKSTYQKAYDEDYVPFCNKAETIPVCTATFNSVRRRFFPHLKKHKSHKRKSGYTCAH